jgi:hypothetical protein
MLFHSGIVYESPQGTLAQVKALADASQVTGGRALQGINNG